MNLDPCPFCGGEAVLDGKSESARGRCLKCGAEGAPAFLEGDDCDRCEAEAAEKWNRRHATVPGSCIKGVYCSCLRDKEHCGSWRAGS